MNLKEDRRKLILNISQMEGAVVKNLRVEVYPEYTIKQVKCFIDSTQNIGSQNIILKKVTDELADEMTVDQIKRTRKDKDNVIHLCAKFLVMKDEIKLQDYSDLIKSENPISSQRSLVNSEADSSDASSIPNLFNAMRRCEEKQNGKETKMLKNKRKRIEEDDFDLGQAKIDLERSFDHLPGQPKKEFFRFEAEILVTGGEDYRREEKLKYFDPHVIEYQEERITIKTVSLEEMKRKLENKTKSKPMNYTKTKSQLYHRDPANDNFNYNRNIINDNRPYNNYYNKRENFKEVSNKKFENANNTNRTYCKEGNNNINNSNFNYSTNRSNKYNSNFQNLNYINDNRNSNYKCQNINSNYNAAININNPVASTERKISDYNNIQLKNSELKKDESPPISKTEFTDNSQKIENPPQEDTGKYDPTFSCLPELQINNTIKSKGDLEESESEDEEKVEYECLSDQMVKILDIEDETKELEKQRRIEIQESIRVHLQEIKMNELKEESNEEEKLNNAGEKIEDIKTEKSKIINNFNAGSANSFSLNRDDSDSDEFMDINEFKPENKEFLEPVEATIGGINKKFLIDNKEASSLNPEIQSKDELEREFAKDLNNDKNKELLEECRNKLMNEKENEQSNKLNVDNNSNINQTLSKDLLIPKKQLENNFSSNNLEPKTSDHYKVSERKNKEDNQMEIDESFPKYHGSNRDSTKNITEPIEDSSRDNTKEDSNKVKNDDNKKKSNSTNQMNAPLLIRESNNLNTNFSSNNSYSKYQTNLNEFSKTQTITTRNQEHYKSEKREVSSKQAPEKEDYFDPNNFRSTNPTNNNKKDILNKNEHRLTKYSNNINKSNFPVNKNISITKEENSSRQSKQNIPNNPSKPHIKNSQREQEQGDNNKNQNLTLFSAPKNPLCDIFDKVKDSFGNLFRARFSNRLTAANIQLYLQKYYEFFDDLKKVPLEIAFNYSKRKKINIVLDIDNTFLHADTVKHERMLNSMTQYAKEKNIQRYLISLTYREREMQMSFIFRKHIKEFFTKFDKYTNFLINSKGLDIYAEKVAEFIDKEFKVKILKHRIQGRIENQRGKSLKNFIDYQRNESEFLNNCIIIDDKPENWEGVYHNVIASHKFITFSRENLTFPDLREKHAEMFPFFMNVCDEKITMVNFEGPEVVYGDRAPIIIEYENSFNHQFKYLNEMLENMYKISHITNIKMHHILRFIRENILIGYKFNLDYFVWEEEDLETIKKNKEDRLYFLRNKLKLIIRIQGGTTGSIEEADFIIVHSKKISAQNKFKNKHVVNCKFITDSFLNMKIPDENIECYKEFS